MAISRSSSREEALTFARRLLRRLGWLPDHFAAFLIGSIASGNSDALSDIDILIVSNSLPTPEKRRAAYAQLADTRTMLGFFSRDSPILPSNVGAVDKLWIGERRVDIAFCSLHELSAYDCQHAVCIFPDQQSLPPKPPGKERASSDWSREDRLRYAFRILHVHRERYRRECERGRWMVIDLTAFLFAARDIVLVLNGHWRYSVRDPQTWSLFASATSSTPHLSVLLHDIRQLDDRLQHRQKEESMGSLILALEQLCPPSTQGIDLYDHLD